MVLESFMTWRYCSALACSVASVVSNSRRLHRLWVTRLLCPSDSPGKNAEIPWRKKFSRGPSQPMSLASPALQADSLPTEPTGKEVVHLPFFLLLSIICISSFSVFIEYECREIFVFWLKSLRGDSHKWHYSVKKNKTLVKFIMPVTKVFLKR